MMVSPVSLECKKICMFRCLYVVGLSVGMQYMLLTVFLLLVNFSILHPIVWITDTFRLMFSFCTWLSIMPLISSVIIFGILQGKLFLSAQKYYATRFAWIWGTAVRKAALFGIHLTVGFLTAWLYSRFIHDDYKNLVLRLQDREFINSRYVFLIFVGISSGLYFFVKKNLRQDPEIEFSIIQEMKFIKIRSLLYSALYQSLLKSFGSTIIIALSYWILGGIVNRRIAKIFTAETDEQLDTLFSVMTNFRMLLYGWLLCSQILCNMQLMTQFFSIFLGEELRFTIEKDPLMAAAGSEVSLVEALALSKVPVIQKLASLDLYSLSVAKAADRRQEIFALSVPGGHPYNWNQLSAQCLAIINEFTEELSSSVKRISTVKSSPLCAVMKPCSNETVEKILLRQYNETYGIRRMMPDPVESPRPECNPTDSIDPCQRVNAVFDRFQKSIEEILKSAFHAIPGLFYLFGELDGAKTAFLLSNSQGIVWLIEGLAGICASSLNEDKYGVVQNELSKIMSALLKLKLELDKLNNVNINGKKFDRNLITLKNAVKRSLYRVCTVFGDYLRDLVEDQDDFRHFQCFVSYQET